MNDYVRGAFEALLADIKPYKDPRDQLKKAITEGVVVVHQISETAPQLQPRNASLNPTQRLYQYEATRIRYTSRHDQRRNPD